ncbi:MAG: 4Fe-4S dicluster domain-containing protein [Chthonomonadales bacterium]
MASVAVSCRELSVVEAGDLSYLLDALQRRGYGVIGPQIRDGVIVLDALRSVGDLPAGWAEVTAGGRYSLKRTASPFFFRCSPGAQSWKYWLYPPKVRLWRARREGAGFQIAQDEQSPPRLALLGVHSCDLHALFRLDAVLRDGQRADPVYCARRREAFIIAVTCSEPGPTCFCASMGTGPRPTEGYDLCITEVQEGRRHYMLVEAGSASGSEVLEEVPHSKPDEKQAALPATLANKAAARMGRSVDLQGLREALYERLEDPYWEQIGRRCLTCGNCTMVCPTCFCATVEDATDLTGAEAERTRRWDSCFTAEFTYIVGGSLRYSPAARYRQWLVHKFAAWQDQFGTPGCVGCGRCITWCPVGIDLTQEIRALRNGAQRVKENVDGNA